MQRDGQKQRTFTETARRAQIVDEAVRTIADVGYSRASLGEIARRLGVSKGVISYHFASKEDLIAEIIKTTIEQGASFVRQYVDTAAPASQQLRGYIQGELAFLSAHRAHAIALVEIYNARAADYAPHARAFVAGLQDLLQRGQRDGVFRNFSPAVMAVTIRAAIEAVPHVIAADPQLNLEDYTRELVELFEAATSAAAREPC